MLQQPSVKRHWLPLAMLPVTGGLTTQPEWYSGAEHGSVPSPTHEVQKWNTPWVLQSRLHREKPLQLLCPHRLLSKAEWINSIRLWFINLTTKYLQHCQMNYIRHALHADIWWTKLNRIHCRNVSRCSAMVLLFKALSALMSTIYD